MIAGLAAGAIYLHKKHKESERERVSEEGVASDPDYSNLDFDSSDDSGSNYTPPLSEEELEEIRRKNTPFHFDTRITSDIFESIVEKCAKEIVGIASVEVEGPIVYCKVISAKKGPNWRFTLDFNDYGQLTGNCWIYYEHEYSNIPNRFAALIRDEINKYNEPISNYENEQQFDDPSSFQTRSEESSEERRRKNTPFFFNEGISSNEFYSIVEKHAYTIKEIRSLKIDGPIVYCKVFSSNNGKTWSFEIDFNDYGHLTGHWWATYEGDDAEIPEKLADLIRNEIMIRKHDYSNLPRINLQYKEENQERIILRVNSKSNATYLWQVSSNSNNKWVDLKHTTICIWGITTFSSYSSIIPNEERTQFRSILFFLPEYKNLHCASLLKPSLNNLAAIDCSKS